MEIIRHGEGIIAEKSAVALGNFDGLHTAHMKIIKACIQYAKENNLKSGVMLFDEHTLNTIKGENVPLITELESKFKLLEQAGTDFVYRRSFDEELMKLSPEEFAKYLKASMNVSAVFVGYDYRFGFKAQGDATQLTELGKRYGFSVFVTDKIEYNSQLVKSSAIRKLVSEGDVVTASHMLGRLFSISGRVEKGLRNGHKIGFPTANIAYRDNMLLPSKGVYGGYSLINGVKYRSVINVGNNPTFGGEKTTIESHILGFNGDIYGENVTVEFAFKIRNDVKFNGIDELINQINKDIEFAKDKLTD